MISPASSTMFLMCRPQSNAPALLTLHSGDIMKAGTQLDAAEHLKGMAYHEAGHAVVAYLLVERTYSLSRPPSAPLRQR
jgi:hypothetical protein